LGKDGGKRRRGRGNLKKKRTPGRSKVEKEGCRKGGGKGGCRKSMSGKMSGCGPVWTLLKEEKNNQSWVRGKWGCLWGVKLKGGGERKKHGRVPIVRIRWGPGRREWQARVKNQSKKKKKSEPDGRGKKEGSGVYSKKLVQAIPFKRGGKNQERTTWHPVR